MSMPIHAGHKAPPTNVSDMPKVWTDEDRAWHLLDCPNVLDISRFQDVEPRQMCGCGEASRHTPLAVARRELELETPQVSW